ncbi:MAG: FtsX-like permease family protein [Candidatus Latescibacteria bacterium]|nr:FtsX-like permease family protein [Candidatus Latescibacterota bacterium]
MLIPRLAFRNIFRQRRRSLFTALMMVGGFFLCSISLGLSEGSYNHLIDLFTRDHTGHVQIHRVGYLDRSSLYSTLDQVAALGAQIENAQYVESWTPRVHSPALAFAGDKTTGVRLLGIDPQRESRTTRLANKVDQGRFLSPEPERQVLLGAGIARLLGVGMGEQVALIGQGADGSIANDLFTVVGQLGEGQAYERMNCYIHIETAQEFLALGDRVHQLILTLDRQNRARTVAKALQTTIGPQLEAVPWQVVEQTFYRAMQADRAGTWWSIGIIILMVAVGVLNTVLMTVLERTREFGVLRALGTRPRTLFALIVCETALLALLSIGLGALLSLGANYLLSLHGIPLPTPVEFSGMQFDRMRSAVSWTSLWKPALVTFAAAVGISLFPALRAARLTPVAALGAN